MRLFEVLEILVFITLPSPSEVNNQLKRTEASSFLEPTKQAEVTLLRRTVLLGAVAVELGKTGFLHYRGRSSD